MHSLATACVGLVPRPMPEPGLENAGVVGRPRARVPGTMPRRRARTSHGYSPFYAAMSYRDRDQGVVPSRGDDLNVSRLSRRSTQSTVPCSAFTHAIILTGTRIFIASGITTFFLFFLFSSSLEHSGEEC